MCMETIGLHVLSDEQHLTTYDKGVATTFEQKCIFGPNDQKLIFAKLEYSKSVEEILELNYGILNIVILLCNWVKKNYTNRNATFTRDEYGFTFVHFISFILVSD